MEEDEPTGYVKFEKFLPVMTTILMDRRYKPQPEDVLLKAFQTLDTESQGFLTTDELQKYMMKEGK